MWGGEEGNYEGMHEEWKLILIQETPVSEAHLWEGIKENMEKEVSRREAIVIQHLSSPSASVSGSKVHDSADSKVRSRFLFLFLHWPLPVFFSPRLSFASLFVNSVIGCCFYMWPSHDAASARRPRGSAAPPAPWTLPCAHPCYDQAHRCLLQVNLSLFPHLPRFSSLLFFSSFLK